MISRLLKLLVVVALALPMMSCPTGPVTITPGLWLFTITTPNVGDETAALIFQDGGTTANPSPMPPQASDRFSGTLTWVQNGSTFSLNQVTSVNNEQRYTANVQSSTSMSGTWMRTAGGIASGTWSAVLITVDFRSRLQR